MKFIILFLLFVASRLTSSPGRAFVVLPTPSPHFYHRAAMLKKPTTSTLPAAIFVSTGRAATSILQAGREEVTVFDAEGELSWEEYKKLKPANEYKLNKVDEMHCWKTDECPVEEPEKYTKAWKIRSAERNPPTETHFDSEGEWEEEGKGKWSEKWFEDIGVESVGVQDVAPTRDTGYDI